MKQKSFNNFLKLSGKIKLHDEYIKKTINNYIKKKNDDNKIINNYEISYILFNYYILIHKKIPDYLKNKFLTKFNFNNIIDNIIQDFNEFNMNYPLIISQNKSDNFSISYCNNFLSNHLNFTQTEIKNKDFHDLIPHKIKKEHFFILKQFTLIHNPKFESSNSYILNKKNNLINISINSTILPTLYSFINIITNINIIENKEKSSITYNLFLDKNEYILNISKEFEEYLFFDINKIKLLNIPFNEFFGIKSLEKINEKDKKYPLSNINKAYSIFSTIPNEKMFHLRKTQNKIKHFQKKMYHFSSIIHKNNVLQGLNNLNIILNEKGFDIEWYNIINCLFERFNNIKNDNNENIKSPSSFAKNMKLTKNFKIKDKVIFTLDYFLKEIGNKKYYIVKMKEKISYLQLRQSTATLKTMLTENKKKPIYSFSIIQPQTKRSDNSQKSLLSSMTKQSIIQSPLNESKINININLNENSNITHSMNNSLINSKLIDDSKVTSGINLIQNIANNEIKKINPNNNSINNNNILQIKKTNHLNLLKNTKFEENFLKHYRFLLIISFGIVITLCIILMMIKNKKINEHKELFQFNVYFGVLKTDTYLSSFNSFTMCYDAFYNQIPIDENYFILSKIFSITNDSIKFYQYLEKIKGNNKLSDLYKLLYSYHEFNIIDKNWNIIKKNSTILQEIYIIIYSMYQLYYNKVYKCNFYNFIGKTFENLTKDNGIPSDLEYFTIYGMENTLQNFKPIFENITTKSSNILINYYESYFRFIILFGFLIEIFCFVCYFIILEKLNIDKNQIKRLLIYIFDSDYNNINQSIFENKVYNLRIICEDFIERNISKFEILKNRNLDLINNNSSNNNNHHKKSKGLSKRKRTKSKINIQLNQIHDEEEDNENKKNIYVPKSVIISYIILTLFLISISVIVLINILYSYSIKKRFIYAIIISMNFLERFSKLGEITYYIGISITYNNASYIGTYDEYNETKIVDDYLNYYNIEFEYKNNTQLMLMKESYYPILYIEGKMVENNLKIFLGKNSKILKSIQKWEKEFNTKNYFCFASSLGSLYLIINDLKSSKGFFEILNEKVKECYTYNLGMVEYGLQTEINYIYQELTNLYYDFIKSNNKEFDVFVLLLSTDLSRSFADFDFGFEFVSKTYAFFVMKDIGKMYDQNILFENVISFSMIAVLLFIVVYVFYWIDRGNTKYKKLLKFFSKMN